MSGVHILNSEGYAVSEVHSLNSEGYVAVDPESRHWGSTA